ncbi:MAG: glycosyltransferase family 1 protein [Lachnospiraceae bacterium]
MRIGVDLKPFFSGSRYRGIGMYARNLIQELLDKEQDSQFHFLNLYAPYDNLPELSSNSYLYEYYTGPVVTDVGEKQLFKDKKTLSIIEAEVKHFIETSKIEAMLFTSISEYGNLYKSCWFEGIFKVGILYDLIPMIFPEQCLSSNLFATDYRESIDFLKQMDLLLAISESAKDDAVRLLGIPEEKIEVIYAGIGEEFEKSLQSNGKKIKNKYKIKEDFILFAGGIDFKKNLNGLIEAYSKLDQSIRQNCQLVITGKMPQELSERFQQLANQYNIGGRVICTGYISTEDLVGLYNAAKVLAFPSLYEGFGLPVIEAMACGTPVITSNCSSLKEIAKDYATLVDPKSIKSITKGLQYVFDNYQKVQELAQQSIAYARSYTWENVAKKTMKAIETHITTHAIKPYEFIVTEELLNDVGDVFRKNKLLFQPEDMHCLAKVLLDLQEHNPGNRLDGKLQILYDVTVYCQWMKVGYTTGIARVSKELYSSLKKISWVTPVIVHSAETGFTCTKADMETYSDTHQLVKLSSKNVFFMPEFQIRGVQVPLEHPHVSELKKYGIPSYAVIYDILPIQYPQYFELKTSEKFNGYIHELMEEYTGILTDSQTVADEVRLLYEKEYTGISRTDFKIGYFHLGMNSFETVNTLAVSGILSRFLKNKKTYLMVGTIEPRKGHEQVLEAFEKLWDEGFEGNLCIIGHTGWKMQKFIEYIRQHKKYQKNLLFMEGATDGELVFAYKNSYALIQASAGEGFGLPLIEAGHYNLPIMCSDIPIFHEVAGQAVLYFDRDDITSIKKCIKKLEELTKNGMMPESRNICSLSWNQAAKKVFNMIGNNKDWYIKYNKQSGEKA